jgi:L-fucose isomerase-like protein
MCICEQTLAIFFLSGGNYSICNKFLSHHTSLHVGHVIGCKKKKKNYEEWGWYGLKQWHVTPSSVRIG